MQSLTIYIKTIEKTLKSDEAEVDADKTEINQNTRFPLH